jgi:predicted acyltransferase
MAGRLASLDQFRRYTVAAMLMVNFLGGYKVVPAILKHHNTYCSYADQVMPQFFFAVGFAYRLTFLKRATTLGAGAAASSPARSWHGPVLARPGPGTARSHWW